MKRFINAPLPFQGQKRRFVKQLAEMANKQKRGTVFVDLFGGSGLVSHVLKCSRPDCRVVYNDFDHYSERLENIGCTNQMLRALRPIVATVPHKMRIEEPVRSQVVAEVLKWNKSGFVDWYSISSNLHYTMNYSHDFEEFRKETLYNRIRKDDYDAEGYLEGVEVVSMDYRQLFNQFRDVPEAVFILAPPYLSTDCSTYKSADYWRLSDYLDVLKCLQGTKFVYFTSSKSTIVELVNWIIRNDFHVNPFDGAQIYRHHVSGIALNYDDIMLVKTA